MYKYTFSKHYMHYYKKYRYVSFGCGAPTDFLREHGWPTDYLCLYFATQHAPDVVYFSKTKRSTVPVYGYLIPVKFFDEQYIKE